jgi:aromatic-L-amino-acid/L-tryptophan decarboxylase
MKNKNSKPVIKEESLDPRDWDELKKLGNVMVNDMVNFLQTIREQPVWTKPPQSAKNSFKTPLPYSPMELGEVYNEFKQNILPYYLGNIHPRYWSWVMGAGTAQSMLAEMLAAGMNCNVGIGDQAPMYVDRQVIDWCRQMMSFPPESSGALVSSASVANLNALIVARNSVSTSIRSSGINGQKKMVVYASTETHSSIQKAAEIIGIGSDGVRKVKVNDKYEMDTVHLQELIEEDKKEGNIPFCIVANAGTVNTGAIDPLDKIFWICCKENLWMHVDGAFGALLKLLPEYDEQLDCLEFADSITFDLHKWMSIPYEAGMVLVKDADMHRKTFALQPDYISNNERGIAAGPELTSNFGFELSRNFKALKVWMSLKEHGIEKFARLIRQNITQAKHLTELIEQNEELELTAPTATNIVCFRFNPQKNDLDLDKLNKEILMRLQETGIAAPSYTRLNGNYCMRVANVNHRTITNDFDVLVNEIIKIGNQVVKEEEVAVDC